MELGNKDKTETKWIDDKCRDRVSGRVILGSGHINFTIAILDQTIQRVYQLLLVTQKYNG